MQGKTVVITGATSGIGEVAAHKLAAMGARIVFVARDRTRGEATLARLRERNPKADHRAHYADLSRLAEMKRAGVAIAEAEPRIDVLMNNAGAMFYSRRVTEDNLELTFALNHMSYFVITYILRDRLIATPESRIVSTSSAAHRGAKPAFDDLQSSSSYSSFKVYGRSKLYNILFTRELSRRLKGTGVTANCLHPGFVATRFGDAGSKGAFGIGFRLAKNLALSPEDGARTLIYLASSQEAAGITGQYFDKCAVATPTKQAQDDEAAKRLWAESTRIAGFPE